MPFSGFASKRKLFLLSATCFCIVVLLSYNSSFQQSLTSSRPVISNATNGEGGSIDDGAIEDLESDEAGVTSNATNIAHYPVNIEEDGHNTSDLSFGLSSAHADDFKPVGMSHEQIQAKIHDLRKDWTPPPSRPNHWPPYEWYPSRNYDPNRWEGFDWENGYYISSGVDEREQSPRTSLPYPEYNSPRWKREWRGEYVLCEGPRGPLMSKGNDDIVKSMKLSPNFPLPVIGSAEAIGLDDDSCYDRYNRLGPYGYEQDDNNDVSKYEKPSEQPDWPQVLWGSLQDQCLIANRHRYRPRARRPFGHPADKDMPLDSSKPPTKFTQLTRKPRYHSRTAFLIRTWSNYNYTENDKQSIRALIMELSLWSGGEFQVYLLVHVKNSSSALWSDSQVYQETLEKNVPPEFQSIAILWNEKLLQEWYPKIGDWNVYWHQFMPLQWFSKLYPEFDFVWNWEADARYTGHHYEFLTQIADFAKNASRKYLWERNARFYIPAAHGSYKQWLKNTHASIERAVRNGTMKPVWGPQPYDKIFQDPVGPTPLRSQDSDNFEWGVGEEADLITLQPIWDPTYTMWTYRDKIFNYVPGLRPHFTDQDPLDVNFHHPDFVNIPRRTFINTVARFSRRQLHAMHIENAAGRTMQAEMWPATVALQNSLKAVYAPHPIWADRRWPAWYMDAIFNADGGEEAKWGARADSVYNHDREHNFGGWSWYYDSKFARVLYRRWLGWSTSTGSEEESPDNPLRVLGGEAFEKEGVELEIPAFSSDTDGTSHLLDVRIGGHGRMCLPAMLLHPVKRVYEEADGPVARPPGLMSWLRKLFERQ